MLLWEWCGRVPGLSDALKSIAWQAMSPALCAGFLDMLIDLRYAGPDPKKFAGMWRLILEAAPRLNADFLKVGEGFREKYLESLQDLHWYWTGPGAKRMAKALPTLHRLAARMAGPPFSPKARPGALLCDLACCADPEDLARLEAAPDIAFLKLEDACERV